MNTKIFLIHWNVAECVTLAEDLRGQGWEVEWEAEDGAIAWNRIKKDPPAGVVIFLTRLPSHGRETARALRSFKPTRAIPILFVDGEPEAVEKTREKVPDAVFTTSAELESELARLVSASARVA